MIRKIKIYAVQFLFYFFKIFKINYGKIVVCNFGGKGYGDNPKYIVEYILKNKDKSDFDIVWLCDDLSQKFPTGVRAVKRESIRGVYEQATAGVWIDNSRKPYYVRKRKRQFYVQTWHGGISFKKFEADAQGGLPAEWVKASVNDSKMIDVLLANSEWGKNYLSNNFWYDGEIQLTGSPRNDILFSKTTESIREKIGLDTGTSYVLYAPTFRDDYSLNAYNIDYERLLNLLTRYWGGTWKLLIRFHPIISEKAKDKNIYNSEIINMTSYPDISELMSVSDLLITDYSSCIFDYCVAKDRAIIYASDEKQYMASRGFNFDLHELPFPFASSMDELEVIISSYNEERQAEKNADFLNELGVREDGKASERVADIIYKALNQR